MAVIASVLTLAAASFAHASPLGVDDPQAKFAHENLASHSRRRLRLPADYGAWSRVARCESGGWRVLGASYPDPVGITARNWLWVGGRPLPVGLVPRRERVYVIRVADRLIRRLGIGIPDSAGCAAW